eukprot:3160034-Rhodomonas_salina.1
MDSCLSISVQSHCLAAGYLFASSLWQMSITMDSQGPSMARKSGSGAQIYTTGWRDMDSINRLRTLGTCFEKTVTKDEWVTGCPISSVSRDLFLKNMEAREYETGDHVLAATDWSVRQSDGKMGAGCVFADTNDDSHSGSHNCAVSGEAASQRAEAVALDLLLDHTDPS